MDKEIRLPIKVVSQQKDDIYKPDSGGGGNKVFGEVTTEVREALDFQLGGIDTHFRSSFKVSPLLPGVAKVTLKPKALAKSHRPTAIFDDSTCPIFGVGRLGELYVRVNPDGLRSLRQRIRTVNSKAGVANLSTIHSMSPYSGADALSPDLARLLAPGGRDFPGKLKLRLFRHGQSDVDEALEGGLRAVLSKSGHSTAEAVWYGPSLRVFRILDADPELARRLAGFVGTQSLSLFPTYLLRRTASHPVGAINPADFPSPEAGREYPTIGVVDTGIDPGNAVLAPWIADRHIYVPKGFQDFDHGSFVGGLVVHARRLNNDPRFPDVSSRIVDVAVLPTDGGVTEDELLTVLEEVLPKHPEVRVWNLSLATDQPCAGQSFSELAAALDALQDKYGVVFVIAAGNYVEPPLRGWPAEDLGDADRLAVPADSVRGVAVGSVANLDKPNTRVRRGEPSPFSRRGPGPVYLPKPDVVHYGGNCDANGTFFQTGVLSFSGKSELAENVGTSFSAPLVSTLLANAEASLVAPPSRSLLKALLLQSAVLDSPKLSAMDLRYRGFGVPGDLAAVLTCAPWSATLVFEGRLIPGYEFQKHPFPIPDCLRTADGRVVGEFVMTVAYEPSLDLSYGAEYCRTNVDASLGTYDIGKDGKRHQVGQVPPEPSDMTHLYESELVANSFKWSPVKVYRKRFVRGVAGKEWRLKVDVSHRSGLVDQRPQDFAVVVTMRDPEQSRPVYDEVVAKMAAIGWISQDLQIHQRVRSRI